MALAVEARITGGMEVALLPRMARSIIYVVSVNAVHCKMLPKLSAEEAAEHILEKGSK